MGFLDRLLAPSQKTIEERKAFEQQYPGRPGREEEHCYGAMFINGTGFQPARTLKLYNSNIKGLKKYMLADYWDIKNRDSAMAVLASLAGLQATRTVDMRQHFPEFVVNPLKQMMIDGKYTSEAKKAQVALSKNEPLATAVGALQVKPILASYDEIFSVMDVSSWDIERLAGVARQCYNAEYITEDECYEYLHCSMQMAKEHYKAWREYAIGYILGRGLLYSGEGLGQWTSAAGEMLNEDSIWRQYPLSQ